MLDGKLTYLSARDLRTRCWKEWPPRTLKTWRSSPIHRSKYDAEGSSGILNINLKKNTQRGMSGSVYAGYTYNFQQYGYTYGGSINHKRGKWNSFLNLDAARRVGGREATFTRIFYGPDRTTYFDQVATGNFTAEGPPSVRLGTDYSITDRHSVGFMTNYITNHAVSDFLTDTYIGFSPATPSQYINADNFTSNTFTSFTSNLHYTGKLDTLGTTLSYGPGLRPDQQPGRSEFLQLFYQSDPQPANAGLSVHQYAQRIHYLFGQGRFHASAGSGA